MALIKDDAPNPGSRKAIHAGCTCPPEVNNNGKEPPRPPAGWTLATDCPVHPDLLHVDDEPS